METYLEEVPQIVPPEPPRPILQTRTIEFDRFVRLKKIDAAYYHAPYFVVPRDAVGQEAFAVIRKAMAEKKLVGLGRVVLASRERPILVEPLGNGLRGITLRYQHEVRNAAEYFADIHPMTLPDEMYKSPAYPPDQNGGSRFHWRTQPRTTWSSKLGGVPRYGREIGSDDIQ